MDRAGIGWRYRILSWGVWVALLWAGLVRQTVARPLYAHSIESPDPVSWTLWGPWYGFNEAPALEGEGATTWTLPRGIYVLDAPGSTVWRNSVLLGSVPNDGNFALLEVGDTRSRLLSGNPEYYLFGFVIPVPYQPVCGSYSLGIKGFPDTPYTNNQPMLPGLTYLIDIYTWGYPYPRTGAERVDADQWTGPAVHLADTYTWVRVEYHSPDGVLGWEAIGGGFEESYYHLHVEVAGPPLEILDPIVSSGWCLF